MSNDFLSGVVVGLIFGVLATMVGLTIFARFNTPKVKKKKEADADWWKKGEPPPY